MTGEAQSGGAHAGEEQAGAAQTGEAQADLDQLLGTALGIAQEQLENDGAFLPVALVVTTDGELRMLGVGHPAEAPEPEPGRTAGGEHVRTAGAEHADGEADGDLGEDGYSGVDAEAMVADLYQLLGSQRDEYRAAAVLSDVYLPEEDSDAIHVAAEHAAGLAVSILLPYRPGDGWQFGELIGEPGEHFVWPAEDGANNGTNDGGSD